MRNRVDMRGASVPFVLLESIRWIQFRIISHDCIAFDLCEDRCGCDARAFRIAFNDVHLTWVYMQWITVNKNAVYGDAMRFNVLDCTLKSEPQAGSHAELIDFIGLYMLNSESYRRIAYLLRYCRAFGFWHLLGIVESRDVRVCRKHCSPNGERSCQWTPANFIEAEDDARSSYLGLVAVHFGDAFLLVNFALKAPARRLESMPHPFASISLQRTFENGEFHGICHMQELLYFGYCLHIG